MNQSDAARFCYRDRSETPSRADVLMDGGRRGQERERPMRIVTGEVRAETWRAGTARRDRIHQRAMTIVNVWTIALAVLFLILTGPALAYDYGKLPADEREHLQRMLIWSGDYEGTVDGIIGPTTREAVKRLQRRLGTEADGLITETELEKLGEIADKAYQDANFTLGTDTDAGIHFGMPYGKVAWREKTESGNLYADEASRFRVTTFRIEGIDDTNVGEFADAVFEDVPGYKTLRKNVRKGALTIVGQDRYEALYLKAVRQKNELRGFFIWYDKSLKPTHRRYVAAMDASLEWADGDEEEPKVAEADKGKGDPAREEASLPPADTGSTDKKDEPESFGTAFAIREDGQLLTNAHVVRSCGRIVVPGFGKVIVRNQDDDLDLAVLSLPGVFGLVPAPLADDDAVLAEDVFAFGFPLPNTLGSSIGFSRGSVSSMVGLRAEKRQFRMTAPVQPGNSGGPLLDSEGRVVGVVTSKLNAMRIATETGDIPQGMNFAIKASTLRDYLKRAAIPVGVVRRTATPKQTPLIAKEALRYTYQVLCYPR